MFKVAQRFECRPVRPTLKPVKPPVRPAKPPVTINPAVEYTWDQSLHQHQDLLVSEIASDGENSYIELICPDGLTDLDYHYAVYVMKPHRERQYLVLVSETLISRTILEKLANGQRYVLIGNPDAQYEPHLEAHIPYPSLPNFQI